MHKLQSWVLLEKFALNSTHFPKQFLFLLFARLLISMFLFKEHAKTHSQNTASEKVAYVKLYTSDAAKL